MGNLFFHITKKPKIGLFEPEAMIKETIVEKEVEVEKAEQMLETEEEEKPEAEVVVEKAENLESTTLEVSSNQLKFLKDDQTQLS